MLKTHEIVYDANIKSNRQPKLEKKMLQQMRTSFWKKWA